MFAQQKLRVKHIAPGAAEIVKKKRSLFVRSWSGVIVRMEKGAD